MHYPLSTGGNPQFGGQDELRQLSFERGLPWFPGDVPGTEAGNAWELEQRDLRLKKWQRMPKGKRHNYETLNLGGGRKGEIGDGWSCAYEKLFRGKVPQDEPEPSTGNKDVDMADAENREKEKAVTAALSNPLADISYIPKSTFSNLLKQVPATPMPPRTLVTVRIRMITKGTPISCARIYRLPTGGPELLQTSQEHDPSSMDVDRTSQATVADVPASIPLPGQQQPSRSLVPAPADLYEQWLSLLPHHKNKQHHQPQQQQPSNSIRKNTPLTVEDRQRLIAQQLIAPVLALNGSGAAPSASAAFFPPHSAPPGSAPPPASSLLSTGHPMCPDEHDLIGFVTKGEFNLRDGRGEGIASLSAVMAAEELRRYHGTNTTTTEEEQEDDDDKEAQKMKNGKKRRKTKPPAKAKADMRNSVATRLCVVRNAGEDVGRLARWELVGL